MLAFVSASSISNKGVYCGLLLLVKKISQSAKEHVYCKRQQVVFLFKLYENTKKNCVNINNVEIPGRTVKSASSIMLIYRGSCREVVISRGLAEAAVDHLSSLGSNAGCGELVMLVTVVTAVQGTLP